LTHPDDSTQRLRAHCAELLEQAADRIIGGGLSEWEPFECIVQGESVKAVLLQRHNGALVLVIDVFVDDLDDRVREPLDHWLASHNGTEPFATLRVDRPATGRSATSVLMATHALLGDPLTEEHLAEALAGLVRVARRARAQVDAFLRDVGPQTVDSTDRNPATHATATERASQRDTAPERGDAEPTADPAHPAVGAPHGALAGAVRTTEAILADVDALVGLTAAKDAIHALVRSQEVAAQRRAAGLRVDNPSPHLVLVGNPGTGKTTIARLLGELYRSIGLLPSGHIIETDRVGLVAGYVGQTALKTAEVCEQALGGVLFIDEAYTLAFGGEADFGQEAIDTVLSYMENHRGQLAVVVAGYPAPMLDFIFSNPGLRSRFDKKILFDDYSTEELVEILVRLAAERDYDLTPEALEKVTALIDQWPRQHGFGNAREVRNLFHEMTRQHAVLLDRAGESTEVNPSNDTPSTDPPSTEALRTITAEAVPSPKPPRPRPPDHHPGYL